MANSTKETAARLGVGERVRFFGRLPRPETLDRLGQSHVLAHPSLHDSGGWVCLEAMAAGRPVLCLDLGGPATQVSEATGIRVPAETPHQTLSDLVTAMQRLAADPALRRRMGEAGKARVASQFGLREKIATIARLYPTLGPGLDAETGRVMTRSTSVVAS